MTEIHLLQPDEISLYHQIRAQALQDHPSAYGSSIAEHREKPIAELQNQYARQLQHNEGAIFGAFHQQQLVGIVGLYRLTGDKKRHRGHIFGMYVVDSMRGQGVGSLLLSAAINHLKGMQGIEDVVLAVTVGNDGARNLYQKHGFVGYGVSPRYLKIDGQYYDLEWMMLRVV